MAKITKNMVNSAVVGGTALCVSALIIHSRKKKQQPTTLNDTSWGRTKDFKPYKDCNPENNIILTKTEQLTMNNRPKDPTTARNKNVLVLGAAGSGKTRNVVKPNLLQCASDAYPCSFIVNDPRGELLHDCGHLLLHNGYRIKVLNIRDLKESMCYNPFAYIHSEEDIMRLADCIIENTTDYSAAPNKDEFWPKAERLLYTALIAYIHYEAPKEEQNITTLLDLISNMKIQEDDEYYLNPVDILFSDLEQKNPKHFAVRQYQKYKQAAVRTAMSIHISAAARLLPFDLPDVQNLMASDELELEKLGWKKTALFIIGSEKSYFLNCIAAMCFSQCFDVISRNTDFIIEGRPHLQIRCLIDEASSIGVIPSLERFISTSRANDASVMLVYQSLFQLREQFEQAADAVIACMDIVLYTFHLFLFFLILQSWQHNQLKGEPHAQRKIGILHQNGGGNRPKNHLESGYLDGLSPHGLTALQVPLPGAASDLRPAARGDSLCRLRHLEYQDASVCETRRSRHCPDRRNWWYTQIETCF